MSVIEDDTWIRVYVNVEEDPSIATPVSQFFAYTHQAEPFQTERIGVTRKTYPSGAGSYDRGAYRYIDIPLGHEIRVDLDVGDAAHINVWSVVCYQETPRAISTLRPLCGLFGKRVTEVKAPRS